MVILSALAKQIDPGDVKRLGVLAVLDKAEITPETLAHCVADAIQARGEIL